ncbi:MAG TPA: septal ring lytic transglycosylase RlpA family protein [Solirubrobacteraceae bacterium]|nr:septal ring lytic transglycosylase RlpA family protein [Solirubrobacteraceae bacterium]
MRPSFTLKRTRRVQMAVGALTLMIPASAYALTTSGTANAAGAAPSTTIPNQIGYGHRVKVAGRAPATDAGKRLALEFSIAGRNWRTLATTTIARAGGFRFSVPLQHSGLLRVAGGGVAPEATISGTPQAAVAASGPKFVRVRARFALARRAYNALGGQAVHVRGHLLPWVAGRRVVLQVRSGGSWRTVATGRTGSRGGFNLRYHAVATGDRPLRVRFAGDRLNSHVTALAGTVGVFTQSVASWYSDGGSTACGFHAYYGVANKTLPCGTKVTFEYGGRTVTATVDDRGPFVAGRTWDLNQNTAAALGMGGVATVWSSS